jgi:hypothetical protein
MNDFTERLRQTRSTAVHLEMRDTYAAQDGGGFAEWLRTGTANTDIASPKWTAWAGTIREAVGRGVTIRRARIISEPVTDYIRYEHALTVANVAIGEMVRWLPRHRTFDLALPGVDFWLFDGEVVRFNHFTGDGAWAEPRVTYSTDPSVTRMCARAFGAVWDRGIDHAKYTI